MSKRGDLIETYKILTGNKKFNSQQLLQKATTTDLRGHSLKLYKKSYRLEIRKHSFPPKNCWSLEQSYRTTRCSIRSYHF